MVAGLFNSFADCSVLKCLQRQKDTYLTLRKTERQLSGVLGSKSNTILEDGGEERTHPEPHSFLVLKHRHLQVDGGLRPGLASEADVEGVVAELVAGPALVEPVVAVQHGLDGQSGLPGAVADLEQERVILMIYKLPWLVVESIILKWTIYL